MNPSDLREGAISFRHVTKVYDPAGARVVAVDDWNLEIPGGEFLVVVGPSGCGKTTLLNGLAGFDAITSGEIRLDDRVVASATQKPRPGADRVVVFQNGALFPWKTVLENVTYGPLVQGRMTATQARDAARGLLRKVGLSDVDDAYPRKLSSGVQRRVELVRALINDPRVLLLDEPFRALDAMSKSVMHEHMLQLYDMARKTVFFITHDLEEAIFLADRVVVCTSRPARPKLVVTVDLPRPRTYAVMSSPEYLSLKRRVAEAVHEEAQKAFALGERELA